MYKKIFINLIFLIIFFSACSQKSSCTSSYNVHYVNWGNGTGMQPVFTPSSPSICK